MLKQLIHFSIKNRLFVLAAAFALTLYGLYEMARLPVDVLPDLNRPQVTVLTEAEGLAPEEVETLVTFPIETALNGSTGVQRVRSVSAVGLSIVFVEFDWGQDIYLARQLVGEKLATTRDRLPAGIEPRMGPISSIMGEIMLIGLKSQTIPPVQLRLLADWTVRPRLLSIPGVANAIPIGGGRMQYQVQVDAEKLRAYDLTLEEVERAVANANENSTGGFIEKQSQEFLVRNLGRIRNIAEFADAVVTTRAGTPITVGNVARVLEGIQVKRGDASIDGEPGVIVMVSKQPGQDTVALTRTIEKAMAELRAALPPGVKLDDDVFRQQHFIEASIHNVIEVMRDAAILVTIVLVLFLLNTRTTLISLVAIPLSFIVTFIVFSFAGIGINTMTLGGLAIAIGELVDDSIIDIENVFRRLRENAARPAEQRLNPLRVIYDASNEVRSTLVYATILMVIVFIPLFQLSGIEGRIFAPMGIAYIVSVLASLVVSLTVTPALAAVLLSRYFDDIRVRLEARGLVFHGGEAADSWIVRQLKAIDRVQLGFTLRHPTLVMGAFYGLALVALAAVTQLGREFLPPFNEGTITVTLIAAPGTSLSESNRIGALAEKELLAIGEVALVSRRTGRAELDEHAEGVHSSELEVDFKPGGRPQPAVLAEIRERLGRFPGMVVNVGQPISHRLDHLLSGVNAQIAVKVFGDDLATLRAKAEEVARGDGDGARRDRPVRREAGAHPADPHPDPPRRRQDLRHPGRRPGANARSGPVRQDRHRGAGRPENLRRRGQAERRVSRRRADSGRYADRHADRRQGAAARRRRRDRGYGTEPDSARERPAPHRDSGQRRRARSRRGHRRPPGSHRRARSTSDGLLRHLRRAVRGPAAGHTHHRRCCPSYRCC